MKQRIKLSESTLHRIIKESVKNVLKEGHDPALREQCKSINYHYTEAMRNLEQLYKEYEKLPDEYYHMKDSNMSTIRMAIKELKMAYPGINWEDSVEDTRARAEARKSLRLPED